MALIKQRKKRKITSYEEEEARSQRIARLRSELKALEEELTDKKSGKRIISDYEDDRAHHLSVELVKELGIMFDEEIRKQGVAELVEEFRYLRNKKMIDF